MSSDGWMIVPQTRDKGWERRQSGREVLTFPAEVGRWSQRVRGRRPQPCHPGEERVLSLLGAPREEGLPWAALQS